MKKFLITLLIILSAVILATGVFLVLFLTGYDVYREISYCDTSLEVMDIYIPNDAYEDGECGCVLFIHGGSWTSGDKSEEALRCRNVANSGYIAATMNYTLYSEENRDTFTVDAVLREISAALLKIRDFAAEKGIKVTKAATAGYSAGAHLSMLYSYSIGDGAPLEIVFTANMAGPADFSPEIWGSAAKVISERLLGITLTDEMLKSGEADEILAIPSPVTYVNESTVPSIFAYGGKDGTVSEKNGESLKAKFDEYGLSYDYIYFPDSDHSLISNPIKRIKYNLTLIDYCEKYFN